MRGRSKARESRFGRLAHNAPRLMGLLAARHVQAPPKHLPILLLFVTDRCNLQCSMCGVYKRRAELSDQDELSTDECKDIIDATARLGTMIISFAGGEPLLRPDIYELIRYSRTRGLAVHLCTNGTTIDAKTASRLQDAGIGTISVSVESSTPEIHERLRGPGSFEAAIRGIRMLNEHAPGVRIGINVLISALNYENITDMVPFAESLGVDQIKFAPIHTNLLHRRKPIQEFARLVFDETHFQELDAEVRKLMTALRNTRLQTTSTRFLRGITDLYRHPRLFRCFAGYATCAIDPIGNVAPCCDMEGCLNVRDMPLDDIWSSRSFHELRRRVHLCNRACWDTTNTELGLRLSPASLFTDVSETWQDLKFYFGRSRG